MQKLTPTLRSTGDLCQEISAAPAGLIVFGASGDLAHRKLFPSLFRLWQKGLLDESFYLLGCGRRKLSDDDFRNSASQAIATAYKDAQQQIEKFLQRFYYTIGTYEDKQFYQAISTRLEQLDRQHKMRNSHVFYLSVPPNLYLTIVKGLDAAGMSCPEKSANGYQARLVVEKPFGRDLQSARKLNQAIGKCFHESRVYRIDHYLGKETVQNILMFRFANSIFEPVWNNNYVDHVEVTIVEKDGVGTRGSYYDSSGAIRDILQNHTLQLICLAAMEPPVSFSADSVRDEKIKLLQSIRPLTAESLTRDVVLGQYAPGTIDGTEVPGYLDEDAVAQDSQTETFVAARLFIDNWRWSGVPFYVRTGKRMGAKKTEIAVTFKQLPHSMFASIGINHLPANTLIMRIQPDEGISLRFQAKGPGGKKCISTLDMRFNYKEIFDVDIPEAYQRLLLDCMAGDQTLFMRYDAVEVSWKLLEPILADKRPKDCKPVQYPAGAESFPHADELMGADRRQWRPLEEL